MPHTIRKTVFISYRRIDAYHTWAVYQFLIARLYTVFVDQTRLNSGAFDKNLLRHIEEHDHFILMLTPNALDRCINADDWVRREIEHALETKRNIVPLLFDGFDWPNATPYLSGELAILNRYNSVKIPGAYFMSAMAEVTNRFLNIALEDVVHPQRVADTVPIPDVALTAEQYVELARRHIQAKQFDRAIHAASRAIELETGYADAYIARGDAHESKAEYVKAVADFSQAIERYPKDAALYLRRSMLYVKKRDLALALTDASKAIDLNPRYLDAYRVRAQIYELLGIYTLADADELEARRLTHKR